MPCSLTSISCGTVAAQQLRADGQLFLSAERDVVAARVSRRASRSRSSTSTMTSRNASSPALISCTTSHRSYRSQMSDGHASPSPCTSRYALVDGSQLGARRAIASPMRRSHQSRSSVARGSRSTMRSEISDAGLQSATPIGLPRWSTTRTAPAGDDGRAVTSLR